jgi:hypothetical protein
MKILLLVFLLIPAFKTESVFQFDGEENRLKVLNNFFRIFSRDNFEALLELISFEELSETCLKDTNFVRQSILRNPVAGLTDGYWALKSKGDFSFDILEEVEYVFNNL